MPSPGPVSRFTDQVSRFWSGCCCQIICLLSGSWSRLQVLLYILLLLSAVSACGLICILVSGLMYLAIWSCCLVLGQGPAYISLTNLTRWVVDNINVTRMIMMTKKEFYKRNSPQSFVLATKFACPDILSIAREQTNILDEWWYDYCHEHV